MLNNNIEILKKLLRLRISRFVSHKPEWRNHVYSFLNQVRSLHNQKPAYICGGAVRDILLASHSCIPRDLDIILGYCDIQDLFNYFRKYPKKQNRFGGVSLYVKDWTVDIWPLSDTWAFRENKVTCNGFADFPKTTFLNIDAIAVQLFTKRGKKRNIFSDGFFESMLSKTLEINYEENPYPDICTIKALLSAKKYNFSIGPKLAKYILYYSTKFEIEELLQISKKYNVRQKLSKDILKSLIRHIESELRISKTKSIYLPDFELSTVGMVMRSLAMRDSIATCLDPCGV